MRRLAERKATERRTYSGDMCHARSLTLMTYSTRNLSNFKPTKEEYKTAINLEPCLDNHIGNSIAFSMYRPIRQANVGPDMTLPSITPLWTIRHRFASRGGPIIGIPG
jgi:hypothetical protein